MKAYRIPIENVDALAKEHGYFKIDFQDNIAMVSYSKGDVRLNIYLTRMTVATCLKHPKKGKTQLFRRNVSFEGLKDIFANPRQHTGKGYYKL